MKIYFIRHGETEFNRQKIFYGMTDVSINQKGREQSQLLQEKLKSVSIEYPVYTSKLMRTKQTAAIIFPTHQQYPCAFLDEKSFGKWEGQNAASIQRNYPQEWQAWLEEPFQATPTEAEDFLLFEERVLAGFQKLLAQEESMVIVGHLGVIRVILSWCCPEKVFWEIELNQGNYTCIKYHSEKFSILEWNQ